MRQEFLDKIAKIEDGSSVMEIKGLHLLADSILRRYDK